ncbi:MAG: SUF system NifU family Fe-S cluster assembly protein [Rhodospirillaceae bacterium]|nr:SUF system NifU family Fe-S cluster assembly protein [Rhodospirillaceae bacterium]
MNAATAEAGDLLSLYQEIILEHGKRPRNARAVEHATCSAAGNNPLCGDRVTVTARVDGGVIADVGALAKGCAISVASASLMTEVLKGRSTESAARLFKAVKDLCTGTTGLEAAKAAAGADLGDSVERLAALSGVSQFPVRVKCATLPWHALMSCLAGGGAATTETPAAPG